MMIKQMKIQKKEPETAVKISADSQKNPTASFPSKSSKFRLSLNYLN